MVDRSEGPKKGGYGPGYGSKALKETVTVSILSKNPRSWQGYFLSAGTRFAGGFCVYCFDSGKCSRCGRGIGSGTARDTKGQVFAGRGAGTGVGSLFIEPSLTYPCPRRYQYPTTDRIRQLLTTAIGSYRNRKVKTVTLTGNST